MRTEVEGTTTRQPVALPEVAGLRVHLIGIGGSGMSGAALLLAKLGAVVSGSDLAPFDAAGTLVAAGALVHIGHRSDHLAPDVGLVVTSAAVPADNPELAAARARGLPIIKYAELLGVLMRTRCGVAIAGTHGKSTTTAMAVHAFRCAGLDPSFVMGARSEQAGGSSGMGAGAHFIVESCEFDRSFLHLQPQSAAILNIEADHLDCYEVFERVVEAFGAFAGQVAPEGLLVANGDDPYVVQAAEFAAARVETFGFNEQADWQAVNVRNGDAGFAFDAHYCGLRLFSTQLAIPGRYNVGNALAAAALAHHAGAEPAAIAEALSTFTGVHRRLTLRGNSRGVTLLDDYAHHPTEIRVTIEAVRQRYRPRRLRVLFQPHQYARTCHFMDEFAAALSQADEIVITDIYGARESDPRACRDGAKDLAQRIGKLNGWARYAESLTAAADLLAENAVEGDLIVTMGAGDVWKVADDLVGRLC